MGVAISLGYTLNVVFFVDFLGWKAPALASMACFVIWTPISYIAVTGLNATRSLCPPLNPGHHFVTINAIPVGEHCFQHLNQNLIRHEIWL